MINDRLLAALLSVLALAAFNGTARADEPIDEKPYISAARGARTTADNVCSVCHGSNGVSKWDYIPSLAGLDQTYLIDQLKGLRARNRATHYSQAAMWGMAANLKDDDIEALAAYFSGMAAPAGNKADCHADVDLGKSVFEKGLTDRSVPACQTCHVQGRGDVNIPRVAGQHAEYMTRALRDFHDGFRVNDNMNFIAGKMTDDEIKAVSAYMSTLNTPSPASPSVPADRPAAQ
jgi:cytochrome c553